MPKSSAGILMYRHAGKSIEVLLVHPGGPYWTKKDAGAWSIPKGEWEPGDDVLAAARREFEEETGFAVDGEFIPLPPCKQAGGKVITAWAIEGDCQADEIESNTFSMEWPPKSGRLQEFPEVDRAEWFSIAEARVKMNTGQWPLLDALRDHLAI